MSAPYQSALSIAAVPRQGNGDGSQGNEAAIPASGLAHMTYTAQITKHNKSQTGDYAAKPRNISREFGITRMRHQQEQADLALTNPTEFYKRRAAEYDTMEDQVLAVYQDTFARYMKRGWTEDDAADRAELLAKQLMNSISEVIESDYGKSAAAAAQSRKVLQSAGEVLAGGGVQL
jgi:hypothetical protein